MSPVMAAINQASAHLAAGRAAQARDVMLRAAGRFGREPAVLVALIQALTVLGESATLVFWGEKLIALAPHLAQGHLARAHGLATGGRLAEAIAPYQRAVELDASNPEAFRGLAWVLHRERRYREAAAAAERGIALLPDDADLLQKRAVALLALGRIPEAGAAYDDAVARQPTSVPLAEAAALCTNYRSDLTQEQVRRAHERFGTLLTAATRSSAVVPPSFPGPGERLRVGIISPDLRQHSVSYYAGSILEHADRARLDVFAYYTFWKHDEQTERLKQLAGEARWRWFRTADPEEIDRAIRADRIDVLIELSGLTSENNLAVVARKPAPVIATYIGYPNTTGLAAVDYRFVDSLTDPVPDGDAWSTEKLVRLDPCFLCYSPPVELPPVTWQPPAQAGRPPTFGSFNNLMKFNDGILTAWGRLLAMVPEARLALKTYGLDHADIRADLLERCAAAGIPADRLDLIPPPAGTREHLDAYNLVDVGLDTFPYHGTTTTCEAFAMGVPVVSIEGDRHVSRVGVSLLRNLGTPELIGKDADDANRIAAEIVRDVPRLTEYRRSIRSKLLGGPLCDGAAYGRRLADAILRMSCR